jgi:hypothetical protein
MLWPIWTGADKYEEWIYTNSTWTKIGETSVDLSNYFNTATQTSDAITEWSSNLFLTTQERTKLSNTSWTNTGDQSASDFDIKDLADSTSLRSKWNNKQDAIADLSDIRTGAGKWATAVQPSDLATIATSGKLEDATWDADDISEWTDHKFLTSAERTKLGNTSWTNTGDETGTTIKTKLWVASSSADGYLKKEDFATFNWKQDAITNSDDITQWSTNLFMTAWERAKLGNQSWTNTWDETQATIKTKLGTASASADWYLTKEDFATFNGKQNAISDLATIRNNATAGAWAATTIAWYWDVVSHDASEFATAAQWAKADTALQPSDISDSAFDDTWDWDTSHAPSKNAIYDAIIQVINNAWASDHLEEKAPVWELYTLSDDMFLQQTPALDDSIIEQAVWNTADNTQIHIQRVSSWTASNKLKLKVKKVWSPWDLTVQVMKWISVVVTADVEAYWYWDFSNTIASWTLSASNVTTSFQELEVTLNANFWWTKEELLNVVLSQSSVNASNYYVIACDSTQWSEWFSFVAVNGNTRTRSKIMPYCVSDWFSKCLLSKASTDAVSLSQSIKNRVWNAMGYQTILYTRDSNGWRWTLIKEYTFNKSGNIELYVECSQSGYYNFSIKAYNNDTEIVNANRTSTTYTGTVDKDSVLWVYAYIWEATPRQSNYKWYLDIIVDKLYKNFDITWLPRELSSLWENAAYTTFWRHIDWTWVTNN